MNEKRKRDEKTEMPLGLKVAIFVTLGALAGHGGKLPKEEAVSINTRHPDVRGDRAAAQRMIDAMVTSGLLAVDGENYVPGREAWCAWSACSFDVADALSTDAL